MRQGWHIVNHDYKKSYSIIIFPLFRFSMSALNSILLDSPLFSVATIHAIFFVSDNSFHVIIATDSTFQAPIIHLSPYSFYFPNNPFFFGGGTGAGGGAPFMLKNLSDESSSRTYQKYCAMGMMNDPTTRTAIRAVYFP